MKDEDVIRRAESVLWRRAGSEVFVVFSRGFEPVSLGPVGSLVWTGLSNARPTSEVVAQIAAEASDDSVSSEARRVIGMLLMAGVLASTSRPSSDVMEQRTTDPRDPGTR